MRAAAAAAAAARACTHVPYVRRGDAPGPHSQAYAHAHWRKLTLTPRQAPAQACMRIVVYRGSLRRCRRRPLLLLLLLLLRMQPHHMLVEQRHGKHLYWLLLLLLLLLPWQSPRHLLRVRVRRLRLRRRLLLRPHLQLQLLQQRLLLH